MSQERLRRLSKLLTLQGKLKALHETRHAAQLAAAAQAASDAAEIAARSDGETSLSSLFPDIYHRGISRADERRAQALRAAAAEASQVAAATVRRGIVEDAYRETARLIERETGDRERLEIVERRLNGRR